MKRLIIILLILLMLCGCTKASRPDFEQLADTLSQVDERYYFEYFDMFCYKDSYRVFLSILNEDDVLISMDLEDNLNIGTLTVTAMKKSFDSVNGRAELKKLFGAVLQVFSQDGEEVIGEIGADEDPLYFSDFYKEHTGRRYKYTLSSNSEFISLCVRYYEDMSIS